MFKTSKQKKITFIEAKNLKNYGIVHAFCTRLGGISSFPYESLNFSSTEGDLEGNVRENWRIVSEAFGLSSERFFTVRQVHGDKILVVKSLYGDCGLEYDALVTTEKGLALGVKTADCVPVLIASKSGGMVSAVHAGWRGTSLEISYKTVRFIMDQFNMKGSELMAAIGPAIGKCCYQVDSVVYDSTRKIPGAELFEYCGDGKWMFDLPETNRLQLIEAGIPAGNIFSSRACTVCNNNMFFSYRAEQTTGRQLNFILIGD